MTWIQIPVHELDSSCLTGALHEYNFLFTNLAHPAWLEHCMNTTTCSITWFILPDWSMTWIQHSVYELESFYLTGAWHKYNFLVMNFIHPTWLKNNMDTTSWSWTWLVLPDWSIAWMQFLCKELDSSCLTGALHAYNYLVKNLIHPAWLEHCMNTITWSRTWFILPDWSIAWIKLPGQELDSSYLTQEWHEYNFLVMNLTCPAWLEHCMNAISL